jgi:transposase
LRPSSRRRELRRRAGAIGPETEALVDLILRAKPHPEQGFRACIGIVGLVRPHGRDALEAACRRAREIGGLSYSSVRSILQSEPRSAPPVRAPRRTLHRRRPSKPAEGPAITHPNIRRTKGTPLFQSGPPPAGRASYFH